MAKFVAHITADEGNGVSAGSPGDGSADRTYLITSHREIVAHPFTADELSASAALTSEFDDN
jgi:hypothetical protein